MLEPKVSIIIPFKELNKHVNKCIEKCLELDYNNYDIILLPDEAINTNSPKTKVIVTGKVHPSIKRNLAVSKTDSEFIASIDSDAYPDKDWLKNAIPFFKDQNIGAVGGPNSIPKDASLLEKAAIHIIYSKLGLDSAYRIKKYNNKGYECRELASSNLIFRKNVLEKVHGYKHTLPTGEDSMISFDIRKSGKLIIYSSDVKVYHHRRKLFLPHLERIYQQAYDKAIILKKSFSFNNLIYFVPSFFVLFLLLGLIISLVNVYFKMLYLSIIGFYSFVILIESIKTKDIRIMILFIIGLPFTHIAYGLGFLRGLLKLNAESS